MLMKKGMGECEPAFAGSNGSKKERGWCRGSRPPFGGPTSQGNTSEVPPDHTSSLNFTSPQGNTTHLHSPRRTEANIQKVRNYIQSKCHSLRQGRQTLMAF
jgi:hypothetical protein